MLGTRHAFALFASVVFAVGCGSEGEEAPPTGDAASEEAAAPAEDAAMDAPTPPEDVGAEEAEAAPTPMMVAVSIPVGAIGKGTAAYVPNPVTISVGSTVTWTNDDAIPHTTTSDTGVWDSGTLNGGQSFSFTFTAPGTFPYHCSIHGAASMSGTVTVE